MYSIRMIVGLRRSVPFRRRPRQFM
jgi:hypothetical protein